MGTKPRILIKKIMNMKKVKYIIGSCLALLVMWNCQVDDNLDYLNDVVAPTEVTALMQVTQDNTGLVTITPNAVGASFFNIVFGDENVTPEEVIAGESISHVYAEGSYTVNVEAVGITGLTTVATVPLVVSFNAPENLNVVIENDVAISKQVNVTANADFAISFEVYFGELGNDDPVIANIGETVSYVYQEPGTYTIRTVVMGAAIETTEHVEEFEVTEILQPLASAPTPPNRNANDVISIYSVIDSDIDPIASVYSDVMGTNYFPDWGQAGQGSGWATFDLDGTDEMLNYINLSYQGIALADNTSVDVSGMEFLHMDVWTANEGQKIETSLINNASGVVTEAPVWSDLVAGVWTSIEIPISDYTDQGLTVTEIFQMKFVGDPWAAGTVFIDNIYFYRAPSTSGPSVTPITFETPFELSSFDGGNISVVANPDTNGNSSSMVSQMVKDAGQPWAGSKITIPSPFSFANSTVVTAKVWSPRAGLNLLFKFEDAVPWPNVTGTAEITATTTVANQWEVLTFDFTGIDTNIDWYNLVMIMDNGTMGDGTANYTIYVDDISSDPILDFEPEFSLSSFDGGDISVIANPDTNGNASAMVAQMIKGAGQPWAGSKITAPIPFTFEGGTIVKVKVWSPRVGLNLLLKFEDDVPWPNVTGTAEITATTTVANQWEELTFDFAGIDTNIDWYNLVLIMDNGTVGDGSSDYTIYLDDISQN